MRTLPVPRDHGVDEPLRIVAVGGGTGLSTLLRGLKHYVPEVEITAIVAVTDDGGSSGRLRREFDVLPPGDIRNCMVALSEDEALMSRLFQYRFSAGRGLKGHSFGNLFLTALNHLTGDFATTIKLSSEVLASAGRIYPVTASNVTLEATLVDGRRVVGESRISKSRARISRIQLNPARCKPLKDALQAIAQADLITLGPGSLYTSVVPNLLVKGIPEAIRASKAVKAYFMNLMWQPGETTGYTASEHVQVLYDHAGMPFLDSVIINTERLSPAVLKRYAAQNAMPVVNDREQLQTLGVHVVGADLATKSHKIRHNPEIAAALAVNLARGARTRSVANSQA